MAESVFQASAVPPWPGVQGSPVGTLECVYQPIVELGSRQVVGFEALARWPAAPGLRPDVVFAKARRDGTLDVVDRQAQRAAVAGAGAARLPDSYTLFVNVEADTPGGVCPARTLVDAAHRSGWAGPVVIELTERALLTDPARVLEITDRARAAGVGVALDDVGADPDSLMMLEFVAPDVIKIDGALIRSRHLSAAQCAAIDAIGGYVETAPATRIIAEGIETLADVEQALAVGATHGQGWFFGRPGPLPDAVPALPGTQGGLIVPQATSSGASSGASQAPSAVLEHQRTRIARRNMLTRLSTHLENTAATLGGPVTVLATFQHARNFTPAIANRFSTLAATHPHAFVAVFGVDMPQHPAPHVHGTPITPGDGLTQDWIITVMAPHYFATLIARDLGDPDTDTDRRYTYLLTHDRRTVTTTARALVQRLHTHTPHPPARDVIPTLPTRTGTRTHVTQT